MNHANSATFWKRWWLPILALILVTLNFWLWLSCRDYTSLASENAKHLNKAYEIHQALQQGQSLSTALNTITYPPLFYIPAVILFALTGVHSEALALASMWPFVLLTAAATFGICRHLQLPDSEALTAAFLTTTALSVSIQAEGFIIEFALMSLISAALYLVIASNYLHQRFSTLALGLICGLGVLMKWTFVAYLPVAVLISLYVTIKERSRWRNRALNWVIALAISAMLAHMWYGAVHVNDNLGTQDTNLKQTFAHFTHSQSTEVEVRSEQVKRENYNRVWGWGPVALVTYLGASIVPVHLTPFIVWGLAVALYNLRRPDAPRRTILLVALTFGFILVIFTIYPSPALFSPQKALRHLGAAVPLASCFAVFGLRTLAKGRKPALILLNVVAAITTLSWMVPASPRWLEAPCFRPTIITTHSWEYRDPLGWLSAPKSSPFVPVVKAINKAIAAGYTPLFRFSEEQDFQPLLVELYGHNGPRAVALEKRGEYIYLDGCTQYTEPDTPVLDLSSAVIVQQEALDPHTPFSPQLNARGYIVRVPTGRQFFYLTPQVNSAP